MRQLHSWTASPPSGSRPGTLVERTHKSLPVEMDYIGLFRFHHHRMNIYMWSGWQKRCWAPGWIDRPELGQAGWMRSGRSRGTIKLKRCRPRRTGPFTENSSAGIGNFNVRSYWTAISILSYLFDLTEGRYPCQVPLAVSFDIGAGWKWCCRYRPFPHSHFAQRVPRRPCQ